MRKFYIKRLQSIHGKPKTVYIKRLLNRLDQSKFFPTDSLKIATLFTESGIKEFQLLGALPNIDYTVVEVDQECKAIAEFNLESFS